MICLVGFMERERKASSICSKTTVVLGPWPLLAVGEADQMLSQFQVFKR